MCGISTVCVILCVAAVSDSARILAVFPTPSISHQVVFRPVTLELAKRGHEVVVVTTDPIFPRGKAPANYTEIDVHDISYAQWNKFVEASSGIVRDLSVQLKIAMEQLLTIFKIQLQTTEVQNVIRDTRKFDLLFVEACVKPALVLSHILKVPTIQFSSFGALSGMFEAVGAPTHPNFYPLPVRQKIGNLTVWEKISEYYSNYWIEKSLYDQEANDQDEMNKLFGPHVPSANELYKNVDMIFLNVHSLWDFNRPVPPNVVYLGGLHQKARKDLPTELNSYLDRSTHGVIYMSLGTNVKPSTMPSEKVRIILKAFSSLPYDVLWKWDQDELKGRPANVKIGKWFPQSDLLHHPNVKLFITQGGLQSTDEALTAGVPLVGIPMLGDQWYNTEMYVHYKIGEKLNLETLNEDNLRNAIKTVLKDGSYRANIVKLRTLMRDQPQSGLDRAVWWTEYVLRHGGARHLRSPAAGITWVEYLELELVFTVLTALILSLVVLAVLLRMAIRWLSTSFHVKVKAN